MSNTNPPWMADDGIECPRDDCDGVAEHPKHVTVRAGRAVDIDCPECGRHTAIRRAVSSVEV